MSAATLLAIQRRFARDVAAAPDGSSLAVYRRNAELVRVRALGLIYPVCLRVVGQECFDALALRYVREVACRVHALDRDGHGFDRYWEWLVGEHDGFEELGYLPELARFERARHDVSIAPDDVPFDWTSLERADPSRQGGWVFEVSASLRVVRTGWDLLALFGEDGVEGTGTVALAVRRVGDEVVHEALPEAMAELIDALCEGTTLDGLDARGLAERVEPALARGLIVGVRLPEDAA